MKPFNLEEAKAGKPVCTRDGRDVRIICWDMAYYEEEDNKNPIVALIKHDNGQETIETYTSNGGFYNDREESRYDLIMKEEPTLDDYTTIKTYEDACKALSIEPIVNKLDLVKVVGNEQILLPKHIIALMKMETISCALWGREWQPKPDAEGSECHWFPWFGLFTEEEIEDMREEDRGALLSCDSHGGSTAGFGLLYAYSRSSYTNANSGFRLCQETKEKAAYFGKQFIELWAEYLKFNFEVGGRLL